MYWNYDRHTPTSLSNPHFHSQSYLNYECILLCTNYRIKWSQCILVLRFTNVIVTTTHIPVTVVRVAVSVTNPVNTLYLRISCLFQITCFWVNHSCAIGSAESVHCSTVGIHIIMSGQPNIFRYMYQSLCPVLFTVWFECNCEVLVPEHSHLCFKRLKGWPGNTLKLED